ncbi:MAG: hypothetical protein AAF558_10045 [Verrucomicrobiota bacterium]
MKKQSSGVRLNFLAKLCLAILLFFHISAIYVGMEVISGGAEEMLGVPSGIAYFSIIGSVIALLFIFSMNGGLTWLGEGLIKKARSGEVKSKDSEDDD